MPNCTPHLFSASRKKEVHQCRHYWLKLRTETSDAQLRTYPQDATAGGMPQSAEMGRVADEVAQFGAAPAAAVKARFAMDYGAPRAFLADGMILAACRT